MIITSFVGSGSLSSSPGLKCEYTALTEEHIDNINVKSWLFTKDRSD